MKDDATHRFQRLLRLLTTIQEKPGQSAQELAEQFGTSKRNLFRDIKLLQDSGFEIDSENGYRLNGSGLPVPSAGPYLGQGLNPWEVSAAGPVRIEIQVEPALARQLAQAPLHISQRLSNGRLSLQVSGPDRVLDWLMSVQGAELLEPSWLRSSLHRRAQELVKRYT
ncbi:MAG: HTH domain-containing protein [Candidatus Eremiobacteraeota bacterium]|nr:HTH domain-containing protein [Candidatus Eremiobacteraeota bacterium]MCW5868258.1 HTH domain-containing protein [Candidatus Eremiobacteraeota bacterium]